MQPTVSRIRSDSPEPYGWPADGPQGEKRVFVVILFTSLSRSLVSRISGAVHAPCQAYHSVQVAKFSVPLHMANQTFLAQFDVRTGEIKTVSYQLRYELCNVILFFLTDILIFFVVLLFLESIKNLARTGRTVLLSTASISLAPDLSH